MASSTALLESSSVAFLARQQGFDLGIVRLHGHVCFGRSIASIESIPLHDHGVRLKYILTFTDFRYGTSRFQIDYALRPFTDVWSIKNRPRRVTWYLRSQRSCGLVPYWRNFCDGTMCDSSSVSNGDTSCYSTDHSVVIISELTSLITPMEGYEAPKDERPPWTPTWSTIWCERRHRQTIRMTVRPTYLQAREKASMVPLHMNAVCLVTSWCFVQCVWDLCSRFDRRHKCVELGWRTYKCRNGFHNDGRYWVCFWYHRRRSSDSQTMVSIPCLTSFPDKRRLWVWGLSIHYKTTP
jgi:hypothetical protein